MDLFRVSVCRYIVRYNMKEFVEKLIGRLEEQKIVVNGISGIAWNNAVRMCIYEVYQLAEEYRNEDTKNN